MKRPEIYPNKIDSLVIVLNYYHTIKTKITDVKTQMIYMSRSRP